MYDIIINILGLAPSDVQIVYFICGALIIIFTVVIIDLVYRVFGHFWRSRR